MTNYTIQKHIIGSKKSRTVEYEYSIKKDNKFLHEGACRMMFSSMKKAKEFAENFNEETADANRYRWF